MHPSTITSPDATTRAIAYIVHAARCRHRLAMNFRRHFGPKDPFVALNKASSAAFLDAARILKQEAAAPSSPSH